MPRHTHPLLTDEFLDRVAKEISQLNNVSPIEEREGIRPQNKKRQS
ncbi:hypothetical protein [Bacillus sp. S/N-304-OC-R1]|nr:hypothetical protein [Bacillus sp. S/N-304-OC-R1]MBY0123066.1 bacitracin ABC transporter ATP-binding protein [Bacillus sp. S/N-304-OC-R1]